MTGSIGDSIFTMSLDDGNPGVFTIPGLVHFLGSVSLPQSGSRQGKGNMGTAGNMGHISIIFFFAFCFSS